MAKKKHISLNEFLKALRKDVNLKAYVANPKKFLGQAGLSAKDRKTLSQSGVPHAIRILAKKVGLFIASKTVGSRGGGALLLARDKGTRRRRRNPHLQNLEQEEVVEFEIEGGQQPQASALLLRTEPE